MLRRIVLCIPLALVVVSAPVLPESARSAAPAVVPAVVNR